MELIRREHLKWSALGLALLVALLWLSPSFRTFVGFGGGRSLLLTVALFLFGPPLAATLLEAFQQEPPSARK